MEIDKIVFGRLSGTAKTDKSFDDLDVNNDGKINKEDENLATNLEIKNAISQILAFDVEEEEDIVLLDNEKTGNAKKSLEEFKKSITAGYRSAWLSNADKMVNDKGYNNGTTFVVYNCLSVSTKHCGSLAVHAEIFNNNFSNILETMYDLSDQANFIYQPTTTWGRDKCGLDNGGVIQGGNKPCIIKYVDGVAKDIIWLDDKDCSTDGFRNLITSNIEGYKENNSNVNNQESNNQDVTDITTVNSTNNITDLTEEYERLQDEKKLLEFKYANENAKFEEAQQLLDIYTKEYDNYQKEIDEVNNQILKEQNRQQTAQQEQMDSIINDAINSYDKEKDGDFNEYLQKAMDTKGYPIYSCVALLTDNVNILSSKAKNVLNNIMIQSSIVASLKLSLKSVSSELNGINSQLKSINDKIITNTNNINDNIFTTDKTSPTTKKETINSDNIDWSALKVEGKGINIYNLFTLLSNDGRLNLRTVRDKYASYTDEEKAIVNLFCDTKTGWNKGLTVLGNSFNNMTRWDRDGDGFLSDDDIQEIKILAENGSNKNWNVSFHDRATEFGMMAIDAHSTTINGKKVYISGNLCITEDEIDTFKNVVDENGKFQGGTAMSEAISKLGGKTLGTQSYAKCSGDYWIYSYEYTNSVGITSSTGTKHLATDMVKQIKNILALAEKERGM